MAETRTGLLTLLGDWILSQLRGLRRRAWWVNHHSSEWREWAHLEPGGGIAIYDQNGDFVRRTQYGSRIKAVAALKRMGYVRLPVSELPEFISPPPG